MPTGARPTTPVSRHWQYLQMLQRQQEAQAAYERQQQQAQAQQRQERELSGLPYFPTPTNPPPGIPPPWSQTMGQPAPSAYRVDSQPAGTYSFRGPSPSPGGTGPTPGGNQTGPGGVPPLPPPVSYTEPTNYFGSAVGDQGKAYEAYQNIAGNTGSLAWDALMNNKDAQVELYGSASGGSDSFTNWLRRNGGEFYNRYVSESAQANDPAMQFSDWMHGATGQNLQHEYLREAPESRNHFPGLAQPQARWIMQN